MNINRIFDSKPDYGEDGEITLSKEYTKDNGEIFSTVKPQCRIDAKVLIVCGVPFICKDGATAFDAQIIARWIIYVFELSESEVDGFQINDYMKLMNYIMDKFTADL